MKHAAVLLALTLPLAAQEVVSLPVGQPRPGAAAWHSLGVVDSQPHSNVLKLMELSGDRERLQQALPKLLSDAKAKMLKAFPGINPAFASEWEKRMATRLSVDDFLNVGARVYEKHFTNDEILDLIALANSKKEGKPAKVSAQLQAEGRCRNAGYYGRNRGRDYGIRRADWRPGRQRDRQRASRIRPAEGPARF